MEGCDICHRGQRRLRSLYAEIFRRQQTPRCTRWLTAALQDKMSSNEVDPDSTERVVDGILQGLQFLRKQQVFFFFFFKGVKK